MHTHRRAHYPTMSRPTAETATAALPTLWLSLPAPPCLPFPRIPLPHLSVLTSSPTIPRHVPLSTTPRPSTPSLSYSPYLISPTHPSYRSLLRIPPTYPSYPPHDPSSSNPPTLYPRHTFRRPSSLAAGESKRHQPQGGRAATRAQGQASSQLGTAAPRRAVVKRWVRTTSSCRRRRLRLYEARVSRSVARCPARRAEWDPRWEQGGEVPPLLRAACKAAHIPF